eukprot:1339675-Pyramimonas_sp.AAC.1
MRERKDASKAIGKCIIFGFWGPLDKPLEALLRRFGGVVGRPEATFGGCLWASWEPGNHVPGETSGNMISNEALLGLLKAVLGASRASFGTYWA